MVVIFCGLATSVLIARNLGPEANGVIASLLVYPSLFMTIGSLGIRQSTTYFVGKSVYSDEQIKRAIMQIWVASSIVSLICCYLLIRYVSSQGTQLQYIFLAIMPIPFSLFNTYNSGFFLGKNEIQYFNRINWMPPVMTLLGTVLLTVIISGGVKGYLFSITLGPLLITVILIFKNRYSELFGLKVEWEVIKRMLSLGIVYAFALLVINLNYSLDIILLDKLSSNFETGIYSKGSNVTQYLWQIPMLVSTIVFARSSVSKDNHAFSKRIAQLLRISFVLIGIGSIILLVFSKFIIIGLFGNEFIESVSVLNYLLPGVLLLTIFKVMNMDLAGKGMPWVSLKAMIPALVVNVLLNYLWIPEYGADGAALASTVSYSFAGLLFLYFYSRAAKLPISEIITYKKSDLNLIHEILKKLLR